MNEVVAGAVPNIAPNAAPTRVPRSIDSNDCLSSPFDTRMSRTRSRVSVATGP